MPIISTIGRRSLKTRSLVFVIYVLLLVGALTMVYPFGLMIAGSTKSAVDTPRNDLIPGFLTDDNKLYAKHVEALFNESLEMSRMVFDSDTSAFDKYTMPLAANRALAETWVDFLEKTDLPHPTFAVGCVSARVSRGVTPYALRRFKGLLLEKYPGDISVVNKALGTKFTSWNTFWLQKEDYLRRRDKPSFDTFHMVWADFKNNQPLENRYYFSIEGFYKTLFLKTNYSRHIEKYNQKHGTTYSGYDQVHLPRSLADAADFTPLEKKDWEEFVRTLLNLLWIRADSDAQPYYQEFLKAKYIDLATFNRNYATAYAAFDEVQMPLEPPREGIALSDWAMFVQGWDDPDTQQEYILPVRMLRIHSVDFMYRDYLQEQYGTIEAANQALGTGFTSWMDVLPPQQDFHYFAFKGNTGWLRWEFVRRNFITVIDFMVLHGRGIFNTVVYCFLAVLSALIVNPLAAYALSRYKPPSAYKVLLFLMLTMAFPPMVTMIPQFLMVREFHMLNTYWALILPGMAQGYYIFLLKGFFDSLPQELYESAELDGAGELRIFLQITMNLSKPILAVTALGAFTAAYSNFMFALLICQNQDMWTLMPWLYQLQQRSGEGVVYASLLIAAIPTFAIFAFCQNIIMRGIVVPVEK